MTVLIIWFVVNIALLVVSIFVLHMIREDTKRAENFYQLTARHRGEIERMMERQNDRT